MSSALSPQLPARPDQWESDVVLSDGGTLHLRPIRSEDADRLVELHSRLSPTTIYYRFFSYHPRLADKEVARFTQVDYSDRMAFVAVAGPGQLVAVARYDRVPGSDSAEAAFVVDDPYQGKGLGTLLLEHLAAYARAQGLHRFVADTLADNRAMRDVFRHAGFAETSKFDGGVVRITLDLQPTSEAVAAADERDQLAVVRSVDRLLRPRSVAVIGAGQRPGTIGHEILVTLLRDGFTGPVYPVNPNAIQVAGLSAYADLGSIPGPVDLAVVVVPAERVGEVVLDCGRKGVRGLVVISAGFAETGVEGAASQQALVGLAHAWGMRMIGPNCMGVINTDAAISMNATFARLPPVPGGVGFCSQSGGLGISILEECAVRGLGLSTFVSMGNKADVSGNDLLRYWEQDPATRVGLLYLESIGNARAFRRIAERFSRIKPLLAVKAGRTAAGQRSASSHTAAMASSDAAVDALFRAAGVIRLDRLEQLFDTASYLSTQPPPAGPRVAIVGNSGGPGTLAADACEGRGLEIPTLSEATQSELRNFLAAGAAVGNPVDMVASAGPDEYERAIDLLAADPDVDAVLAIFTPPIVTRADDVARAVARAAARTDKPILANFLSTPGVIDALRTAPRPVPQFSYPESAADALAAALAYGRWRRRPPGVIPELDGIDRDVARRLVSDELTQSPGGVWLDAAGTTDLMACYGIATLAVRRVDSAAEAALAGAGMGFPVALKAASPVIVHKTEEMAVVIGLRDAAALESAYMEMEDRLGTRMGGGLVQAMAPPEGIETIVGAVQDPAFGPLVLFGPGGTLAELSEDSRLLSAPLTDIDASEAVLQSRVHRLLSGYRGQPAVDIDSVIGVVQRVSQLIVDLPEVAELDINPLTAGIGGAVAVDVKVRVAPVSAHPELEVRRLR
ncbi:MAG TPA: GNAT family N-acetyltransferase [Acidimicrobiales bacterium]|nr:GNAT family N-acetyltransferase [Acidimicrobiales bacterium]